MADTLIHRWSQRKNRPQSSSPETESAQDAGLNPANAANAVERETFPPAPDGVTNPAAGETQEPKPEPLELPPLDSLDENSDYSAFMAEGVDEKIKKLALRKLFKSAVFNIRDGLDDYDDDFTTFEELGDIVTSDMKFQQQRLAAEKEQDERDAVAQATADEPVSEAESQAEESAAATDSDVDATDESHPHKPQAAADSSVSEDAPDPGAGGSDTLAETAPSSPDAG